jgi:hypothetical protein
MRRRQLIQTRKTTMAFYKNLTIEQVIDRLVAEDVRTIMMASENGDFSFLGDVLEGNGFTQYKMMKHDALIQEYVEREDRILQLIEDDEMLYNLD